MIPIVILFQSDLSESLTLSRSLYERKSFFECICKMISFVCSHVAIVDSISIWYKESFTNKYSRNKNISTHLCYSWWTHCSKYEGLDGRTYVFMDWKNQFEWSFLLNVLLSLDLFSTGNTMRRFVFETNHVLHVFGWDACESSLFSHLCEVFIDCSYSEKIC